MFSSTHLDVFYNSSRRFLSKNRSKKKRRKSCGVLKKDNLEKATHCVLFPFENAMI
jgi:hypothetical protein